MLYCEFLEKLDNTLSQLLDPGRTFEAIDLDEVGTLRAELQERIRIKKKISAGIQRGSRVIGVFQSGCSIEGEVCYVDYNTITVNTDSGQHEFPRKDVFLNPEQVSQCMDIAVERLKHFRSVETSSIS